MRGGRAGKMAFRSVLAAAAQAGVHVEPQNYKADYSRRAQPEFVYTVNYSDGRVDHAQLRPERGHEIRYGESRSSWLRRA